MNLAYLGDALDYWKGALFEFLEVHHLLQNLAVDPMASDLESWREDDYALFADLLRVTPERIIRHHAALKTPTQYFGEIHHRGDLFLDPDTGIATGRVLDREKYVLPDEVRSLLSGGKNRLVVVYQHVRAKKVPIRVDEVVASIAGAGTLAWCSYESGTVAMLFLSLAELRTRKVARALTERLGRHAVRRVRYGVMNR